MAILTTGGWLSLATLERFLAEQEIVFFFFNINIISFLETFLNAERSNTCFPLYQINQIYSFLTKSGCLTFPNERCYEVLKTYEIESLKIIFFISRYFSKSNIKIMNQIFHQILIFYLIYHHQLKKIRYEHYTHWYLHTSNGGRKGHVTFKNRYSCSMT